MNALAGRAHDAHLLGLELAPLTLLLLGRAYGYLVHRRRPLAPARRRRLRRRPRRRRRQGGVKPGDILVGLDAIEIRSLTEMMAALGMAKPGQKVKITVLRDGKKVTLDGEYAAPRSR